MRQWILSLTLRDKVQLWYVYFRIINVGHLELWINAIIYGKNAAREKMTGGRGKPGLPEQIEIL